MPRNNGNLLGIGRGRGAGAELRETGTSAEQRKAQFLDKFKGSTHKRRAWKLKSPSQKGAPKLQGGGKRAKEGETRETYMY